LALLKLHMHEVRIENNKNQTEQVLAHFVGIFSFVTGWRVRENRQTNKNLEFGNYVRIVFLFNLLKLTYVSFNRIKENPFEQKLG
jgi:hypothetical protein